MKKNLLIATTLLLSTSLVAQEKPDVKTSTENYQDWQISCVEQGKVKRCEMKQTLLNQERKPISVISLAKRTKTDLLMQIALPHMLDLSVPLKLAVDGKNQASLPFKFCNRVACFVIVDHNAAVFNAFKKGKAGVITTRTVNGEEVKLNFSLNGYSSAMKNLPAIK